MMAMASDASVSDTALTQSSTTPSILAPSSAKTSVRPLRVCHCCLREAYEKGRSWDWAIKMS